MGRRAWQVLCCGRSGGGRRLRRVDGGGARAPRPHLVAAAHRPASCPAYCDAIAGAARPAGAAWKPHKLTRACRLHARSSRRAADMRPASGRGLPLPCLRDQRLREGVPNKVVLVAVAIADRARASCVSCTISGVQAGAAGSPRAATCKLHWAGVPQLPPNRGLISCGHSAKSAEASWVPPAPAPAPSRLGSAAGSLQPRRPTDPATASRDGEGKAAADGGRRHGWRRGEPPRRRRRRSARRRRNPSSSVPVLSPAGKS